MQYGWMDFEISIVGSGVQIKLSLQSKLGTQSELQNMNRKIVFSPFKKVYICILSHHKILYIIQIKPILLCPRTTSTL